MSEELIRAELEVLKNDVSTIKDDVRAIRDWQLKTRICQSPDSCTALERAHEDHENRLRFVEKFMWGILGICTLGNVLIAILK